jgi:hypothetical protein
MFKSISESYIRSVERKGSVSIINTSTSTKARGTKRYRRNFIILKRTKTPRNLKGNLLRHNYCNTVKNTITTNQTRASRSAGRAPKTEEGKCKLKSTDRITGHCITVQTVLTINFGSIEIHAGIHHIFV